MNTEYGKPEFLVLGMGCACHGARRCMQWIYQQTGNGYMRIFDSYPAELIEPQKGSTKGYRDLAVSNWAGNEICSETYKFDGNLYREVKSSFRCQAVK